ncbi:hypothetical protein ACLQ24_00200 [Micromonospora sp. DT4]|uniref:hypothetical protein n=1 Tax=Micromonospora sp. DT4 TaxID=3393438 RepID=UPI003CEE6798
MPKIWWRLADVSPLAEHAIHTPTVNAPARLLERAGRLNAMPGLIFELDADGDDTLASTGWPAWYGEDGQPHRAYALTWRHPATATSGSYDHAAPRGDYLLLTVIRRDRSIPRVIDTIREGVQRKHHWFWVDTTGRWPFPCGTADHRDEIVPDTATWIPATVTSRAVHGHRYPALVADGYLGAGGVLPRFTRETAAEIAADLARLNEDGELMPGEFPTMRFDGDVAVISWQQHSLTDERVLEIDRCHRDAEGLYAIGAYQWTWLTTVDQDPGQAHDCLSARTLRYVAHYGAPGTGQAWQCFACGEQWSYVDGVFHPLESGAHLLTPEQCR